MQIIKKIIISILTLESRLILKKYKPFIVAVTGSVGKTSTKDAIYCALKDHGKFVRKSQKSMNSDIGLPLTIIGVPTAWRSMSGWMRNMEEGLKLILRRSEYPNCLVLELGADHPGDISSVAKWLRPDIAVITKVSRTPVHVEFFSSPEQVFEEKASLADAVKPGGTLVLFADDEKVMTMADRVKGKDVKVVSFGMSDGATVKGSGEQTVYENGAPVGISFKLHLDANSVPVLVRGVLGQTYLYPILAAAAVGKARGMSASAIIQAVAKYDAPKGRMNIIPGINGSTLIDDTYNSSPDAVSSALQALKALECSGAKIAVLGDMMELGKHSTEEHYEAGKLAAVSADILCTVGLRSRKLAEGALDAEMDEKNIFQCDDAAEAIKIIKDLVTEHDVILAKGSQSMRIEKVVKALMQHPEQAKELLVRQEEEWNNR